MITPEAVQDAIKQGYRIVSRKHLIAARIDRPDWLDVIKDNINRIATEKSKIVCWEDFYRRVFSKDTIIIPEGWLNLIPNSGHDNTGYIEKAE